MYLNVTTKGRYALRVMLDLARHREEGVVPLKSVAERQGISLKYLEAIVASLRRAGLVESARGKEGGYQLSRRPAEITAYDILSAIELALMEETSGAADKRPVLDSALRAKVYAPLDEAIRASLSSVNLDDILTAIDEESSAYMYFI
jgi:Rrf2 family protein